MGCEHAKGGTKAKNKIGLGLNANKNIKGKKVYNPNKGWCPKQSA